MPSIIEPLKKLLTPYNKVKEPKERKEDQEVYSLNRNYDPPSIQNRKIKPNIKTVISTSLLNEFLVDYFGVHIKEKVGEKRLGSNGRK